MIDSHLTQNKNEDWKHESLFNSINFVELIETNGTRILQIPRSWKRFCDDG